MIQYKVIRVRYLNSNGTLSRSQKLKRITDGQRKPKYYKINSKLRPEFEIDPSKFTTKWEKKPYEQKLKTTVESKWEIIRVKFLPNEEKKTTKISRPRRIYKITTGDKIEYAPLGIKGTAKRIEPSEFITEWEHGKTPTARPLKHYCDESLRTMGYTIEEIKQIRGRNFRSKDVDLVSKNLGISRAEAKELLIANNGNRHTIYEKKNTKGVRIDGKWKTNIPGEKVEKPKHTKKKVNAPHISKSVRKVKKIKRSGRF